MGVCLQPRKYTWLRINGGPENSFTGGKTNVGCSFGGMWTCGNIGEVEIDVEWPR